MSKQEMDDFVLFFQYSPLLTAAFTILKTPPGIVVSTYKLNIACDFIHLEKTPGNFFCFFMLFLLLQLTSSFSGQREI